MGALDLDKLFTDLNRYEKTYKKYYSKVLEDFSCRRKKVRVLIEGEETRLAVSALIVNMILWRPYVVFNKGLTKGLLFDVSKLNSDSISDFLDRAIDDLLTDDNQQALNIALAEVEEELGCISLDFNVLIGNTVNLYDKIQLARRNEEYNKLIHRKLSTKTSFAENEHILERDTKDLLRILATENNCFKDCIRCGEGVNKNQLTQFEINIGPKPDLHGNVYPIPVNNNFLVNGLQSAAEYLIDASGGRKAAIINFGQVKKAQTGIHGRNTMSKSF